MTDGGWNDASFARSATSWRPSRVWQPGEGASTPRTAEDFVLTLRSLALERHPPCCVSSPVV